LRSTKISEKTPTQLNTPTYFGVDFESGVIHCAGHKYFVISA